MSIRKIETVDGIKLQDSVTKELAGSIGRAKTAVPMPFPSKAVESKTTETDIEENLNHRFKQYSNSIAKDRETIEDRHIAPEDWDIVDISEDLIIARNQELMLAELEELKIEKESQAKQANIVKPKTSTATKISERGLTRSWQVEGKKKSKKQLKNEYRLPLERYGPQWLEISKLTEFASHLSKEEVDKVNNVWDRMSEGLPNEAFPLDSSIRLTPSARKHENKTKIRSTRKKAYQLLKTLNRESAINDFVKKAPLFGANGVAADTVLALILRDKLPEADYNLLSWSWRVCFFRIHLEDPFINNPEELN